ncbi:hypothetical protein [Bacillus thuringiensis]|uniref:hypothetical protein n=1 Tax=Bacillus cereus group TaxID=86661 RepID=UPI0005AF09EE|nr:hypothetical protein [Bacillus thuringiensis]MCT6917554.1 hypothetical protein [Bacillus wiedmannii]AMR82826.1 hypothetical protein A3L20_01930 [Bacillus thuringiensis]KIP26346.1 hypothetical protein BG10_3216 [Bacillus thuringiensis serovar morrisoni]MBG9639874.1 hypothetical protein [Bacillus thuringiensis]MBG9672119.1 hypothetical protein [Bacillus thuringiensis]
MRPRRFEYLISYKYYQNNGNADCTYLLNSRSKLNSRKDVLDLINILKEQCNAHTVVINNIQLLREKRAL